MIRRDYVHPRESALAEDRSMVHDNGPAGREHRAPNQSSIEVVHAIPSSEEDALEVERKRNAELSLKLRKVKARNKQLMTSNAVSINPKSTRVQSTIRDTYTSNNSLSTSMNNLSFATLNIAECRPMEGEDDIDRRSFENWRTLLEASMQLVGVTDEVTKMSIFRIKAGPKLLDLLIIWAHLAHPAIIRIQAR
ncbi:uncharacterized protein LOC134210206 [Armigeres subalbatus]|uniref:uncharacterized protein LOC134210206 n=1 Tax=Armigeres subalbatus TaxID=124917 RepID=UPI002ED5516D